MNCKVDLTIWKNKVAIIVFGDEPYIFVIKSDKVSISFIKYFNMLWKMAKK